MTPAIPAKRRSPPAVKAPGRAARRRPARESASPIEDAIEARRIREGRRGFYDDEMLAIVKERGASVESGAVKPIPVDDEFFRRLRAGD